MIRVAVEARARQLLWHFNEWRVFPPSGLKTLNNSTLADFAGLIPLAQGAQPQSVLLEPDLPLSQHRRQINEAGKQHGHPTFVSVTMSAATATVEATSAKSPAPVESAAFRSTAT